MTQINDMISRLDQRVVFVLFCICGLILAGAVYSLNQSQQERMTPGEALTAHEQELVDRIRRKKLYNAAIAWLLGGLVGGATVSGFLWFHLSYNWHWSQSLTVPVAGLLWLGMYTYGGFRSLIYAFRDSTKMGLCILAAVTAFYIGAWYIGGLNLAYIYFEIWVREQVHKLHDVPGAAWVGLALLIGAPVVAILYARFKPQQRPQSASNRYIDQHRQWAEQRINADAIRRQMQQMTAEEEQAEGWMR